MKLTLAYEELVQAVHEYVARRQLGSPTQTVVLYSRPSGTINRSEIWAEVTIAPPKPVEQPKPAREAVGEDAPVRPRIEDGARTVAPRNPYGIGSPDDDTEDDGTPRP